MNKELPSVFANRIDKEINNEQEIFTTINDYNREISSTDVMKKINEIFSSKDFVYKKDVKITTKYGIINTTIIGINNDNLLTMDNRSINVNDIIDIH